MLAWSSALSTVLLLVIPAIAANSVPDRVAAVRWLLYALPPVVLGSSWLFRVKGFTLESGELLVHRPFWITRISLAGLSEVRTGAELLRRSIRIAGNGGVYSFTGLYRSKELGMYRCYLTDPARSVALKLSSRTVVVSPGDPAGFIEALRRQTPGACGQACACKHT